MTGLQPYAVDLDQVLDTIDVLTRVGADLDDVLDGVHRQVAALQVDWEGLAAAAQDVAQTEWESGFATMREGLATMRDAAEVAHDNYTGVVETNLAMWSSLW